MASRKQVKSKVIALLRRVANFGTTQPITEDDKLKTDLLLETRLIESLAFVFTRISRSFGGTRIYLSQARSLETVRDTIELVHKHANE